MTRNATVLVLLTFAISWLLPAAFIAPPVQRSPAAFEYSKLQATNDSVSEATIGYISTFCAAAMVGVLVGLVAAPQMASAVPRSRPDFMLARPDYMQGADAANAAVKPGEVDFVTRSRIEALQFPTALKEADVVKQKMQAAPTKEERLQKAMSQIKELAKVAEIPS
jgi:hypothetical protein